MRRVLACVAALYRMPLFLVQGRVPAARTGELPVPHKYRRSFSHQAAGEQLDLFGLPGAKYSTLEFEWQQLPEEIRETVTRLMVRLLFDYQRGDRQPNSAGKCRDV
jgi:hypothetical protein